ncbi:PREDICTED: uncharacterized protein LOC109147155 [Ipomoea nil]|uniref:uncharacterized protein LOC109147155 n=1 Tax=Ipomoea nil TaxID=35883 RepID=UPI000901851E|nr:PREDICTED: uncharacterized protein LOC109147155 [Ipomoea nil]
MEMMYYQLGRSSYQESLKVLESDIQHANALAAAIPRQKGTSHLQMELVYNQLAPLFLFLLRWIDCSCTCLLSDYLNPIYILIYKVDAEGRLKISRHGRKATVSDFYAVILPSLRRLHFDLVEFGNAKDAWESIVGKKRLKGDSKFAEFDREREAECGICLEPCTKMVLPNCCHSMCMNCYRDWNMRSESCPFCRGSLKRVKSKDLWVLTSNDDVVDPDAVSKEDLLRFYLYIKSLPKNYPDALFLMYYEYLI